MFIIGLTGGIACGKSAVADEFRNYGAVTFDIDRVTQRLLKPGGELFSTYVQHFGEGVLNEEGRLNRKSIGEIIFKNIEERKWINSVAHPVLLNHTRDFLVKCSERGDALVILEIPLLFEVGWEFLVDETWAVYVTKEKQIWRLMQRDGFTREQAQNRINAQMSPEEIAKRADVVIYNNNKNHLHIRKFILNYLIKKFVTIPFN